MRIPLSVALLACPVFSPLFYVLYFVTGLTDILDGFIARKTNTVSAFGATLDSVADIIFVLVCLVKFLPAISLPIWVYRWIALIAVIKAFHVICGFVFHKQLIPLHTTLNKVTGASLFVFPFVLPFVLHSAIQAISFDLCAIMLCSLATLATIQEGHLIRTGTTV